MRTWTTNLRLYYVLIVTTWVSWHFFNDYRPIPYGVSFHYCFAILVVLISVHLALSVMRSHHELLLPSSNWRQSFFFLPLKPTGNLHISVCKLVLRVDYFLWVNLWHQNTHFCQYSLIERTFINIFLFFRVMKAHCRWNYVQTVSSLF